MKILIIEDEPELAADIATYLLSQGYLCEHAGTWMQAREKVELYRYDCILLDLMLPGGDGMDILDMLKDQGQQDGVIIISAKDDYDHKIRGLRAGADDYLAKPFHLPELAARIYSVIRRRNFANQNSIIQNELKVDLDARVVTVNGTLVALTRKELDLLLYFIGNRNRVIAKSALAEHLSGDIADMFDNHDFVYAHVKNLKKKLSDAGYGNYLKTIYATGYKWEG
ncbi:DNA-binding response regulator [Dyadobacter beijingensis]|uniref:DNA-binding response regulator n=1 Tax=Dyadobacter beijingensis TaxID=365489 RepID=A0ABQ2HKJ0_9BACT|nr:response regulator transcription factor [Dyadobacter beijingensis]GGM84573.1 DNA-binding response regulator [Dyadobacter beijingensis]